VLRITAETFWGSKVKGRCYKAEQCSCVISCEWKTTRI